MSAKITTSSEPLSIIEGDCDGLDTCCPAVPVGYGMLPTGGAGVATVGVPAIITSEPTPLAQDGGKPPARARASVDTMWGADLNERHGSVSPADLR